MKKNLYFIPRNTWFYTTFSRFSALIRYSMTVGILCLLVLLWLSTSYRLFSQKQATYLINIHNAQHQKNIFEDMQKNLQQLQIIIQEKKRDMHLLATFIMMPDFYLQELLRILQQNNLSLQTYIPQPSKNKKWYTKHTLRLDCYGNYENILSCIQHIENSQLPFVYSQLNLEKQKEGILASCHISWYDFSKVCECEKY